jgi:multidrug efflux pump
MARFFIDRPVFAWVLALLVMIAGALALFNLPVAQFPPLAPPQIGITVTYPGASAETAENTVVQVIEQPLPEQSMDRLAASWRQHHPDERVPLIPGFNTDLSQKFAQLHPLPAFPRPVHYSQ